MTRLLCIHGHAYQPPREDPATGAVPRQPSAAPYHDWNERITDECYRPFGAARLLGDDGEPRSLTDLYGHVSFDLGPTLGTWLDREAPDVAATIAAGDRAAQGAMAHPYVHAIMPLTPAGDRATMLLWGRDDFERRFGRRPTGVWFPETAIDTASLEAARDLGMTWTIVEPGQVERLDGAPLDGLPCQAMLPSGRTFDLLAYDGPLSHQVSFGGLLEDGERLADTIVAAAATVDRGLTIVASDIETYGHHHRFGEMALARAVEIWGEGDEVELITPARYLERVTERTAVRLVERRSWSCAHGIGRWRENCGCRFHEGTDQSWRAPLRDILAGLGEAAARLMATAATDDVIDPYAARDAYGRVLAAARDEEAVARFAAVHAAPGAEPARVIAWMEAERLRLEAWSSCAWFFDTVDRIETVQTLLQAVNAAERFDALAGSTLRPWLLAQIERDGFTLLAPGDGSADD